MEIAANGDIGLDIHHHNMFAITDGLERDQRAGIGIACRINEYFNPTSGRQSRDITRNRQKTALNRRINRARALGLNNKVTAIAIFDGNFDGVRDISNSDSPKPYAGHPVELYDQIRSHLANTHNSDGDGLARCGPGLQIGD